MENYFILSEQFHTQADPACTHSEVDHLSSRVNPGVVCGLGTLTMCLNALNLDPHRQWRGPWRWFSEELLDCCVPLETIRKVGITLEEFSCLARCNGAQAEVYRSSERCMREWSFSSLCNLLRFVLHSFVAVLLFCFISCFILVFLKCTLSAFFSCYRYPLFSSLLTWVLVVRLIISGRGFEP